MLAQDIARAGAARVPVKRVGAHGVERGDTFDHLEPVCGDHQRLGGRVVAVIGAADPLDEALDILVRADLDNQVHIAPVDPEVQRACADDGLEVARDHGGFDAGALRAVERSVMDSNG